MRKTVKETRLQKVLVACSDERIRVNEAIAAGGYAEITTFCGVFTITSVNDDWWYMSYPKGKQPGWANQRSWCGANDGTWANIMAQLGLKRHSLFAE